MTAYKMEDQGLILVMVKMVVQVLPASYQADMRALTMNEGSQNMNLTTYFGAENTWDPSSLSHTYLHGIML